MSEVTAIIEDPRGSTVRHHWNEQEQSWLAAPHRFSHRPWPANYGFIPETLNDADGDELDVLVLSSDPLSTGSRVIVRPVGLLLRPDGDDKILGVLIGDPEFGQIERFGQVSAEQIEVIEKWFADWSEVGEWQDESAAVERIQRSQLRQAGIDTPTWPGPDNC